MKDNKHVANNKKDKSEKRKKKVNFVLRKRVMRSERSVIITLVAKVFNILPIKLATACYEYVGCCVVYITFI